MTGIDEVLRQLTRVRRRRTAYRLQRALFALSAAATLTATAITGLALVSPPWIFLTGAAISLVAFAVALVPIGRDIRRAFDHSRRVASWVDEHTALNGRLSTLVELAARQPTPTFLPLLVDQNTQRLPTWEPSRAIPRPVPLPSLAAALTGIAALCVLLLTAPRLAPSLPEIIGTADTPTGALSAAGNGDPSGRFVLSPIDSHDDGSPSTPGSAPSTAPSTETPSTPSLQDRIRQRLWGDNWERLREAAARSRSGERPQTATRNTEQRASGGAAVPSDRLAKSQTGTREPQQQTGNEAALADANGNDTNLRPTTPRDQRGPGNSGEAAPGAGTGGSPDNLFGPVTTKHTGTDAFELALDAPGRGQDPGSRPPTGDTPPASPDENPQLAARQRPEAAVPHMPVPASYEPIVRALFAHTEPTR